MPLSPEAAFMLWYATHAAKNGIDQDPDNPEHKYDYRAAFQSGQGPDETGHWPSEFKAQDHPNRYVNEDGQALDTITGESSPLAGVLMGPPAPPDYAPQALTGRMEDADQQGSFKSMMPMFKSQLADLISTEAARMTGAQEDNPLVRKLQVAGSNAPAMIGGSALEALVLHLLAKKFPGISSKLQGANTAYRGSLAGQNMGIVGAAPNTDNRLMPWINK
jgi:hypothetical protein